LNGASWCGSTAIIVTDRHALASATIGTLVGVAASIVRGFRGTVRSSVQRRVQVPRTECVEGLVLLHRVATFGAMHGDLACLTGLGRISPLDALTTQALLHVACAWHSCATGSTLDGGQLDHASAFTSGGTTCKIAAAVHSTTLVGGGGARDRGVVLVDIVAISCCIAQTVAASVRLQHALTRTANIENFSCHTTSSNALGSLAVVGSTASTR